MPEVDVLIVTALKEEHDAAKREAERSGAVAWELKTEQSIRYLIGSYVHASAGITVALARPTRTGGTRTSIVASTLCPILKPKCLAMCGVCAGNPDHVALGDVIIAEMVYAYDEGKRKQDGFDGDFRPVPMKNKWLHIAQDLDINDLPSFNAPVSSKDAQRWLLERLFWKDVPDKHPARSRYLPDEKWASEITALQKDGTIQLSGSTLKLTRAGQRGIDQWLYLNTETPKTLPFKIRVGPMASGNVVVKDGVTWNMLKSTGVGSVVGLEMEAATIGAVAHDLEVPGRLVVKGVMDHADPRKNDRFKPFAARASAEVLFKLLPQIMGPSPKPTPPKRPPTRLELTVDREFNSDSQAEQDRLLAAAPDQIPAKSDSSKPTLIIVATAWGASFGGINAFSLDFSIALGRELKGHARVICLTAPNDDKERQVIADNEGVEIVTLSSIASGAPSQVAGEARDLLTKKGVGQVNLVFGHDVFTGPIAIELARLFGGKSAVIHHMSYIRYQAVKADGEVASAKHHEQEKVLKGADHVLAVGPLLRDSASELCDSESNVSMIVPGLQNIESKKVRKESFRAIAFGRLGGDDERIKQGKLAAIGYARFVRLAEGKLNSRTQLNLFGFPEDEYKSEESTLKELLEKEAGRVFNVVACAYTENRKQLFASLRSNEVAMMLSWHEGFGLVGWEAIAAGVPLIVSKNSGLYKLIEQEYGSLVESIDVRGTYGGQPNERDVDTTAHALFRIAAKMPDWLERASKLRERLANIYTWDRCAKDALNACGWKPPSGNLQATKVVEDAPSKSKQEPLYKKNGGNSMASSKEDPPNKDSRETTSGTDADLSAHVLDAIHGVEKSLTVLPIELVASIRDKVREALNAYSKQLANEVKSCNTPRLAGIIVQHCEIKPIFIALHDLADRPNLDDKTLRALVDIVNIVLPINADRPLLAKLTTDPNSWFLVDSFGSLTFAEIMMAGKDRSAASYATPTETSKLRGKFAIPWETPPPQDPSVAGGDNTALLLTALDILESLKSELDARAPGSFSSLCFGAGLVTKQITGAGLQSIKSHLKLMGDEVEKSLRSDKELSKRLSYSVIWLPSDQLHREHLCKSIEIVHEYAPSMFFVEIVDGRGDEHHVYSRGIFRMLKKVNPTL